MNFRWMLLLLAVLIALPAFAHGDKKHVIGTIEKISADSVTVKTADGKSVEVKLAATTLYVTKDGKPAKFADVAAAHANLGIIFGQVLRHTLGERGHQHPLAGVDALADLA